MKRNVFGKYIYTCPEFPSKDLLPPNGTHEKKNAIPKGNVGF